MHTATVIFLSTALFASTRAIAASDITFRSGPAPVPLIELYTSEGCSSCPPAEKWLGDLQRDPELWKSFVPVAFHVNYWDHLGWRDILASAANTERQYARAAKWGSPSVYTPCFVRNGNEWRPSGNRAADLALTGSGKPDAGTLTLVSQGDGAYRIEYTPPAQAKAGAAGYDVGVTLLGGGIVSKVRAGENSGRELRHEFVALRLETEALKRNESGTYFGFVTLASRPEINASRYAIAAWVMKRGDSLPLQAVGGWLE